MGEIWFIVTKSGETANLLDIVKESKGDAVVLAIGPKELAEEAAHGTAAVKWIDPGTAPAETVSSAAAELLEQASPSLSIGYGTSGVCATLGIAAWKTGAACVSNVIGATLDRSTVAVEHLIVDNKIVETVDMPAPACLVVDTMSFQPLEADALAPQAPIEQVSATPSGFCSVESIEAIPASGVESADIVVGVGRGINTQDKFDAAKRLADALGAEISGSMPGVKDFGWFPEGSDYVGLTGVNLNARLYIALGISGSTPHLAGLMNAQTIVCVNSDANAQLFSHSDYGIVADAQEVIPELIRAIG